ncbi:MAG: transcription elongation factor GreAB [Deltaproteobacteria bacterium]|nr:transcription elongation factor GreAB [Deltaproteobacteria bacterium]
MIVDNIIKSIFITERHAERLQGLIDFAMPSNENDRRSIEQLEDELYRANIVKPEDMPVDVVTINSKVQMIEIDSDLEVVFTLVYPADADLKMHRISVFSPIGSAVFGRRIDDIIEWRAPTKIMRAEIKKIISQSES